MDYSALGFRFISYIGDNQNPLDITENVANLGELKTSAIDLMVGYVKTEITITLVSDTPGFLETRFNDRWAEGAKVEFFLRNSQGTFVKHRTFRILEQWFDDGQGEGAAQPGIESLELEMGDLFSWKDRKYPNPGDVKIPILGNAIDVPIMTTVNYWLRTFNLPEATFLPGERVPPERITTTGLYSGNSSILEHIFKILGVNSRCIGWVDAEERVRIRYIGFEPDTTDYTWQNNSQRVQYFKVFTDAFVLSIPAASLDFVLNPDDMLVNRRSKSEREKVAGLVRVTGTSLFRYPYTDPLAVTTTTTQDNVTITETTATNTTALRRTVTITGKQSITGLSSGGANAADPGNIGDYEDVTESYYGGGFAERPNPDPVKPPIPGLSAYLTSKRQTIREQRKAATGSSLGPIGATKEILTDVKYTPTFSMVQGIPVSGVEISEVLETTKVLPGQSSSNAGGGSGNTVGMNTDQTNKKTWVRLSEGIYLYTEATVVPGDTENRRVSKTTTSIGQSSPPEPDWAPQMVVNEQKEMYAEASFRYPPNAPDNDHPRTYSVGAYLDNNKFAKFLAQIMGMLLIGRNQSQQLAFRPSDAWLADPKPGLRVAVTYNPTEQDLYTLDVPVLMLGENLAYLGGSGIWMGRRSTATGAVTPPYNVTQPVLGYGATVIGFGNIVIGV